MSRRTLAVLALLSLAAALASGCLDADGDEDLDADSTEELDTADVLEEEDVPDTTPSTCDDDIVAGAPCVGDVTCFQSHTCWCGLTYQDGCSCDNGRWACIIDDTCYFGCPSDTVSGGEDADVEHAPDGTADGCEASRDALAAVLYAEPQGFTVVARLDHDSRALVGYALVAGSYATADEATARATAEAATGFGQDATLLSGANPDDAWVFYESPGDFGGVGVVSAHTGLAVFGGAIVWDGGGDITYPATWSPASDLGAGCAATGGFGATRGFDLVTGAALSDADVAVALAVVADTAVLPAIQQGGYAFDAVVLRYPRSVGVFNPATAEWVVVINGGYLE